MGALERKSLDKQKRFKLKINQFFEIILKQKISTTGSAGGLHTG